jgi:hypothetical protein
MRNAGSGDAGQIVYRNESFNTQEGADQPLSGGLSGKELPVGAKYALAGII